MMRNIHVYSTVQKAGDEKGVLNIKWSMNSGQLPLLVDQNQTPGSARGLSTFQSHIQTLRKRRLFWVELHRVEYWQTILLFATCMMGHVGCHRMANNLDAGTSLCDNTSVA